MLDENYYFHFFYMIPDCMGR